MIDEGYIKFDMNWQPADPPPAALVADLNYWRRPLFAAGLIGHYDDLGIGFGNISVRSSDPGLFVISGTQTGRLRELGAEHYALVTDYDVDANCVCCRGPVPASSESMTHAALYDLCPEINAVVHVHCKVLWQRHLGKLPTTRPEIAYGTPDMAREFARLYRDSGFLRHGVAVMGGHEEGIISVGGDLSQAARRVLELWEHWTATEHEAG